MTQVISLVWPVSDTILAVFVVRCTSDQISFDEDSVVIRWASHAALACPSRTSKAQLSAQLLLLSLTS